RNELTMQRKVALFLVVLLLVGFNFLHRLSSDSLFAEWDFVVFHNASWQLANHGLYTWMGARPFANVVGALALLVTRNGFESLLYLSVLLFFVGLYFFFRIANELFENKIDTVLACVAFSMSYLVTYWVRNAFPYTLAMTLCM